MSKRGASLHPSGVEGELGVPWEGGGGLLLTLFEHHLPLMNQ